MATFPTTFRADSEQVHTEHRAVMEELVELETALDELAGGSGSAADQPLARKIGASGRHLAEAMPEHFRHEEATVLSTVSQVSPELAEFAREMRRQHDGLRARLSEFRQAIERLEAGGDGEEAVARVKELGHELAREMSNHIALEEKELGGFL